MRARRRIEGGGRTAGRARRLERRDDVFERKLQLVALTAQIWQFEVPLDGLPEGCIVVAYHSEDVGKFNPNVLEHIVQ